MDDALRKKILTDLEKSGFGSEMQAVQRFVTRGWNCSPAYVYLDQDLQQGREIDLVAYHWMQENLSSEECIVSFYFVVAEVKKSNKPWIVFGQRIPDGHWERNDAWNNLAHCKGPWDWPPKLVDPLSKYSLLTEQGFLAYSIHESFKDPGDKSRWYSAFVSVSKAGEHVFASEARDKGERSGPRMIMGPCFTFVQPVVLLDGLLFTAELTRSGDVEISEIDEVPFRFTYRSPSYQRLNYRVDLVRLSKVGDYLARCEKRQAAVVSAVHALAHERGSV